MSVSVDGGDCCCCIQSQQQWEVDRARISTHSDHQWCCSVSERLSAQYQWPIADCPHRPNTIRCAFNVWRCWLVYNNKSILSHPYSRFYLMYIYDHLCHIIVLICRCWPNSIWRNYRRRVRTHHRPRICAIFFEQTPPYSPTNPTTMQYCAPFVILSMSIHRLSLNRLHLPTLLYR